MTLTPTIDFDSCSAVPLAWPVHRSSRFVMFFSTTAAGMPE